MLRQAGLFVISLFILAILGLTSFTASKAITNSSAQAVQSDGGQTLPVLLSEVRELRLAIQRSNLNNYHAQITIERMKLQQQRVDRIAAQLVEVRNQLSGTRKDLSKKSTLLKEMEEVVSKGGGRCGQP